MPIIPYQVSLAKCENYNAEIIRAAIDKSFELLGLKKDNPLGRLINPGDHVFLKPNLIRESHATKKYEWEQIITHPFVIHAILDYVYIALKGRGKVTIADGPQTDSDFDEIKRRTKLDDIVRSFQKGGLSVSLLDLRRDRWFQKDDVIFKRVSLPGDPIGYVTIPLDDYSEFIKYPLNGKFYGADYDMADTAKYHADGHHAYVLCRTPMDVDVFINIPKMKTHKKTGVTLSLKNIVGINGYRNCLPHHTIGTAGEGGDEFPTNKISNKLQSRAILGFKKVLVVLGSRGGAISRIIKKSGRLIFGDTGEVIRSGNWYGNDTTWRMVLDLNKSLFYFDGSGRKREKPLKYMTIVDGVVAGEGDGPVSVDAKSCGVIVAGFNPVAVDTVCTIIMGFDYKRIPMLANAWKVKKLPLTQFTVDEVRCSSNVSDWNGTLNDLYKAFHFGFRPHFGWVGHIERPL